ncbi:MAG TPA: chemotaxis protein CheA [Candidatus Krumholzibacteria bacterium]|nr:chemotaxis protein CheA [Candidatus Krumholzibacteria bacterium]
MTTKIEQRNEDQAVQDVDDLEGASGGAEAEDDMEFLEEFITEWMDHLEASQNALLSLEEDPHDMEALNAIFRAFHSIKGGAGFVNLLALQKLAHRAENLLDRARNAEIYITGGYADIALESTDTLRAMIADISAAGGPVTDLPDNYELLIEKLENPEGFVGDAAPAPARAEAVAEAPAAAAVDDPGDDPDFDMPEISDEDLAAGSAAADDEPAEAPAAPTAAARAAAAQQVSEDAKAGKGQPAAANAESATIRVQTDRLDRLINMVGELVVAHSMIEQLGSIEGDGGERYGRTVSLLGKITRDLQSLSMSMRMVPLKASFQKMKRLVRDLARKTDKQVDFVTEGEDTEIDRNVVELVTDPLVHMIRNSMDHGIEPADVRRAAGKPERGRVVLRAYHSDGNVVIEVEDDGRGLDPDRILAKAIEKGLVGERRDLSKREILNLVFAPGFSTAEKVTAVSGRGVGMDVVRRNIEAAHGRIDIESEVGHGSRVSMRIPLTLAIIDGMLIRVGAENFIVPTLSVRQAFRPEGKALTTIVERGEMVRLRDTMIPIYRLASLFGIEGAQGAVTEGLLLLVEPGNGTQYALLVDELLGKQQAVIKSLGQGIGEMPGISGAAILGNGRVGLILDVGGIQRLALNSASAAV